MRAGHDLRPGFASMTGLILAADYPSGSQPGDLNGAARTLRARLPDRRRHRADDPYTTVAMEPDAVDQGFDMLGIIAPSGGRRRRVPLVVGHGR
jgi:hypothetical protein